MAKSVTYEGDVLETSLQGKYKLILIVTATGPYTYTLQFRYKEK